MKQTIFALLTILLLSACSNDAKYSNYKYKFEVFSGGYSSVDYANEYNIDSNGCVHFLDKDGDNMVMCGNFTITERHNH